MERSSALVIVLSFLLAGSGACWRGEARVVPVQPSFVARVDALGELRADAEALQQRLDLVQQRILWLASEAARKALRQDLADLDRDVMQLWRYAAAARERGDDPVVLEGVQRTLRQAASAVADLRQDLLHARTLAEQEALDSQREQLRTFVLRGGELVPDIELRGAVVTGRRLNTLQPEVRHRHLVLQRRATGVP
jgi:hypothetical protein